MKKRVISILLIIFLFALLPAMKAAADDAASGSLGYVTDGAGFLTEEEKQTLAQTAEDVSARYQCGIYIVVLDDLNNYPPYNGDIEACAEELYRSCNLGWGDDRDGLMLIMSASNREYDLAAYGDFGNYAFTDYGKDYLSRSFLDDFRQDNWYGGFQDYLNTAASMLADARNGQPVDVSETPGIELGAGAKLGIAAVPSCLIALLVCSGFKRQMKTANKQQTADEYVVPGSARLHTRDDRFVSRARHVQIIHEQRSSTGGGSHGGTTINVGGFSHHSGKF